MRYSDNMEKAYSDYIDSEANETVSEAIHKAVRDAFFAGWPAAKIGTMDGNPPPTKWGKGPAAFELYRREET